jgi:uncharacterized protein
MILTADMKAVIAAQKLCFVATVSADGKPNLSPKGTIRAFNQDTLFFADLGSPNTRKNLLTNPYMEINVVDILSRRGYRFFGAASVATSGDLYNMAVNTLKGDGEFNYQVKGIVFLKVERAAPLLSPGYINVRDEYEMRDIYKRVRPQLDSEFEDHIDDVGPVQGAVRD